VRKHDSDSRKDAQSIKIVPLLHNITDCLLLWKLSGRGWPRAIGPPDCGERRRVA
jgi:hypothetical protein